MLPHLPELSVLHPEERYLVEWKQKYIDLMAAELIPVIRRFWGSRDSSWCLMQCRMVVTQRAHSNSFRSSVSRIYPKSKSTILFLHILRCPLCLHFTPYTTEGFWHKLHENLSTSRTCHYSFLSLIGRDPAHIVGRTKVKFSANWKNVFSIKTICCTLRGLE